MENNFTTQPIEKFSPETKKKIKRFFVKGLVQIFRFAASFISVVCLLSFKLLRLIFQSFESVTEYICFKLDAVTFIRTPEPVSIETPPAFTDEEIGLMAKKINNRSVTLKEISDKFNISMRQAKKIKDRVNSAVDIHSFLGG